MNEISIGNPANRDVEVWPFEPLNVLIDELEKGRVDIVNYCPARISALEQNLKKLHIVREESDNPTDEIVSATREILTRYLDLFNSANTRIDYVIDLIRSACEKNGLDMSIYDQVPKIYVDKMLKIPDIANEKTPSQNIEELKSFIINIYRKLENAWNDLSSVAVLLKSESGKDTNLLEAAFTKVFISQYDVRTAINSVNTFLKTLEESAK